jgi:hypothetical protein
MRRLTSCQRARSESAHKGKGSVELKTVNGAPLWVVWKDGRLWLRDGKELS